nr:putative metal-binding motif-containing protein [Pseudenhygromyxa sp. WMMC2535]
MDGVPASLDCDDDDPEVYPGAEEICDEKDNDCDELVDNDAVDAPLWYTDADMDGYGDESSSTASCLQPPDSIGQGGDCNDNDPEAYPDANDVCALGRTCKAIYDSGAGIEDGVYLIDPEGVDEGGEPVEVWCDMTEEGMTAALIINSVNEGSDVGDFGDGYVENQQLAVGPSLASSEVSDGVQAWLDLNDFEYTQLRLAAYAGGDEGYLSEWISRDDLRIDFGQNGYLLYNDPNGYYWCGGAKSYADEGEGQVNKPAGAYDDCKTHNNLGSGWDFSESTERNMGMTACGTDGAGWMFRNYEDGFKINYPDGGVAYVVWVR